mmetsp:Transcript_16092/g.50009  ORF Transcript_16092/g.50009 Transcript_16092/m.50009 type:complete len:113 (+) Transcript_16092:761-1099(+)
MPVAPAAAAAAMGDTPFDGGLGDQGLKAEPVPPDLAGAEDGAPLNAEPMAAFALWSAAHCAAAELGGSAPLTPDEDAPGDTPKPLTVPGEAPAGWAAARPPIQKAPPAPAAG